MHSQAIKNTQLVQPQQTLIIIVIYWPLCIRVCVYMRVSAYEFHVYQSGSWKILQASRLRANNS